MSDILSPEITFALSMLVRSTLIVLAAWLIVTAMMALRADARARHLAWLLAFTALAALPVLSLALPPVVIPLPHALASFASPDLSSLGEHVRGGAGFALWVWGGYALGAAAMLARLMLARLALAELWHRAEARDVPADLSALAALAGVKGPIALRCAADSIAPMTWANRILLPAEAMEWPQQQLRDALLHELSHIARRDSLTQFLAAIVRALIWFSPAVWFALRALRLEQERACDERVVAAGAAPAAYAQTLFDVATSLQTPALGMGVSTAMVHRCDLERRLLAVLSPVQSQPLATHHIALFGVAALASLTLISSARLRDQALILAPLGSLPAATPMSAALSTPLQPLATPLRMPDPPRETPAPHN
ncbi:MAG: M56 family metallopeptidase [Terricaulis sp.]